MAKTFTSTTVKMAGHAPNVGNWRRGVARSELVSVWHSEQRRKPGARSAGYLMPSKAPVPPRCFWLHGLTPNFPGLDPCFWLSGESSSTGRLAWSSNTAVLQPLMALEAGVR